MDGIYRYQYFGPASLGTLLGIFCALIPRINALFVPTYLHFLRDPDNLPVLNSLMDFTNHWCCMGR